MTPAAEHRVPAAPAARRPGTWISTPSSPVYPVPATDARVAVATSNAADARSARPRPARAPPWRAAPGPSGPAPRGPHGSAVTSAISHSPRPWHGAASPSASTSGRCSTRSASRGSSLGVDPPHDDVVDHVRVVGIEQVRVLRPARADAVEVVGERPLQQRRTRRRRCTRTEPRCETSNTTARRRGTPGARRARRGYWIGISQPPNGTMLRAERAVLRVERAVPHAIRSRCVRSARSRRRGRRVATAAARGRGRAAGSAPRAASASCDGGSSPYFTSRCR